MILLSSISLDYGTFKYWYCTQHQKTQLHVYSETQRNPKSPFSLIAFIFFRFILLISQNRLTTYFSFTQLGSDYAKRIGIRAETILLPPPIDTTLFKPIEHDIQSSHNALQLLINARYVSYKRHTDVFEAVSILAKLGIKIFLTCIGRGSQVDLQKIRNQSEKYGLTDVVTFINPVNRTKMAELYSRFDVLVLPSDNEAVGMVVPEAMACGLPTITSDTVGANLYVIPNKTGLIFKTKDVYQLVKSIEFFLDKHSLDKAGALARQQIESNFTLEKLISRIRERLR
jgi:glycosyltransferase involved in cell wall biosynthesis